MIGVLKDNFEFWISIHYPFELQGHVEFVLKDQRGLEDSSFEVRLVIHLPFWSWYFFP